jgi:hypothetical protein
VRRGWVGCGEVEVEDGNRFGEGAARSLRQWGEYDTERSY